jgi:hypothetical protein
VLFIKTHKTGSYTIQKLFLRYADSHGLIVAEKQQGMDDDVFRNTSVIDPHLVMQKLNKSYSMSVQRFAYVPVLRELLPPDAATVTIIREPVSRFKSLYNYVQLGDNGGRHYMTLSEFADIAIRWLNDRRDEPNFLKLRGNMGRNQMSADLGMSKADFEDEAKITRFIRKIDREFDLVVIMEKMDESLILLKHLLCWSLRDVVVFRQNARSSRKDDVLRPHQDDALRMINHADLLLYQYFTKKHEESVKRFGRNRMQREVEELKAMTNDVYQECFVKLNPFKYDIAIANRSWTVDLIGFELKQNASSFCRDMAMNPPDYEKAFFERQHRMLS